MKMTLQNKKPHKDKRNILKERWYPTSSNIEKIVVVKTVNHVIVRFKNGALYIYINVKRDDWLKLTNHQYIGQHYNYSIGKAFLDLIIAKNYKYVQIKGRNKKYD